MTQAEHTSAMRRALLGFWTYLEFFLLAVLMLPVFAVVALVMRRTDRGNRHRGQVMRFFGWLTSSLTPLWRFGADGEAPADIRKQPYVVVCNHESTADPFLLCELPFDMRFVAKEELFKLPLIGWLMTLGGDIPLRRGDGNSVKQMFADCRETLAAGVPVMLFPEGTRSKDGNLLPFKDGAFQLAIEMQVPILPLALAGTRDCRPKGSLWFGDARAQVRMLQPISTKGMTAADLPSLREKTRETIAEAVKQLRVDLAHEVPAGRPVEAA